MIEVALISRTPMRHRERELEGQHTEGPWWREPNATPGEDPVIPRHGDQSGGGAL